MARQRALIFAVVIGAAIAGVGRPQGHRSADAAGRMTVPSGFTVSLVAAEPLVRQPVAIDFDDRGRLWVMQYLQYPNPAGLKRVAVDRYSRTAYDRVPEPPPRGPRGADRLTIVDNRLSQDFVAGLNIASGFAFGHGGVFVLQVPYLLFYPDRDRDDVPDADPEVLLTGFGMEDAHSVANSLTWGPDGWLYGCQGSTVTANVRGVEFQQGVWRYHPRTRRFELFCEGGGNSWGLDFDRHGHLIYSTNVGGSVAMHAEQGGLGWKSFGKHGALHHPFAYGFFEHIPHANFRGGHVTVGGILYRGDNYPAQYRDNFIGADLLGHAVRWHELTPHGSSIRSRHGGDLLLANDTWFAPSDVTLGPDGCVYIADWHDARTAHPDPDAEWDRSNGRVYRVAYGPPPPVANLELARRSSDELIKLLGHPNDWYARTARRLLADRRDPAVIGPLRSVVETADDDLALQGLWALYVSGGFDESFAIRTLEHRNPDIRRWVVRLLGDEERACDETARRLEKLAADDPSPVVRAQLACTARRLPAAAAVPIIRRLVLRDQDAADPNIPLLLWWAVERHAIHAAEPIIELFTSPGCWKTAFAREWLAERLVRRYAAAGETSSDRACARLVQSAPLAERGKVLAALGLGLQERRGSRPAMPVLEDVLAGLWRDSPDDPQLVAVLARLGNGPALDRAVALVRDSRVSQEARTGLLRTLADIGAKTGADVAFEVIAGREPATVQLAALAAWQRLGSDEQAVTLVAAYPKLPEPIRARARIIMLGRKGWARMFLRAVTDGKIPPAEVTVDDLQIVTAHRDSELDDLVRKHWGTVRGPTPGERLADVRRFNNDLRAAAGDLRAGHALFVKHCGACHKLFGEGRTVGPDLTHANRFDRDDLLVNIVDPGRVIRKEYLGYTVTTTDGRVLHGLLAQQTPARVTLLDVKGEPTMLPRSDIASMQESAVSLMPEGLLHPLKPQELRDLFSFLQSKQPP
jgi:putative membrane-bound dehydrogenase-like protein